MPQYQTAVDKSRLINYKQALSSIQQAQEIYYLANQYYAGDLRELDIDVTKICPVIYSPSLQNMLFECEGGGYINNTFWGDTAHYIYFSYCPTQGKIGINDRSRCDQAKDLDLFYYYTWDAKYPGVSSKCNGYTARGKRVCQTL